MSLITRLFTGKSLAWRLALGAALVIALVALSLLLPRAIHFTENGPAVQLTAPAYAATNGFVLVYELAGGMDTLEPLLKEVQSVAIAFREAHGLGGPNDEQEDKLIVIAEVRETKERTEDTGDAEPVTTTSVATKAEAQQRRACFMAAQTTTATGGAEEAALRDTPATYERVLYADLEPDLWSRCQ